MSYGCQLYNRVGTFPHTGTNRLDAIHLAPVDGVGAAAFAAEGSDHGPVDHPSRRGEGYSVEGIAARPAPNPTRGGPPTLFPARGGARFGSTVGRNEKEARPNFPRKGSGCGHIARSPRLLADPGVNSSGSLSGVEYANSPQPRLNDQGSLSDERN